MCIPNESYLIDALETVLSWDMPEELLPVMLIEQAFSNDERWQISLDKRH